MTVWRVSTPNVPATVLGCEVLAIFLDDLEVNGRGAAREIVSITAVEDADTDL